MKKLLHALMGLALAVATLGGILPQPGRAAPAVAPAGAAQRVRGEDVRIEGKLYVPQAVFVAARSTETFGRDAIVPEVLDLAPTAEPLAYRLRPEKRDPIATGGATGTPADNGKEP